MVKVSTRWVYSGNIAEDLDAEIAPQAKAFLELQGTAVKHSVLGRLSRLGSGRFYPSRARKGEEHQASAPGEPPASDTSRYYESIEVKVVVFKFVYRLAIQSRLWKKFGRRLELGGYGGGAYIAPRPHIRPAVQEVMGESLILSTGDSEDALG